MRKIMSFLLVLTLMLALSPGMAFAENRNSTYDVSLGEIQQEFIEYITNAGLKLEPGTDVYYNYIVIQLLDHSDEKLREHPRYDLIHAYMAEYKITYEDYLFCREMDDSHKDDIIDIITRSNDCVKVDTSKKEVTFELSSSFLSKTISEIINENQAKNEYCKDQRNPVKIAGYSGTQAASYATQYADSYNSAYPHYSADCANFVSQCVYWGGLSMNGSSVNVGVHDSTSNWYCIYINSILGIRRYAVTTSWIRVADFNTYFGNVGTKTTKTTISALVSACAVGDPVQLADKTTGTAYHTIIISGKNSSTAYFCGHTNSRNNANVYDYLDQTTDKFILFDIT